MPSTAVPSYSSTRVQRASRINSIEHTILQQRLSFIEKAKREKCRVTNQDMRLISLSIDYIQSSSGRSPEAWSPEREKLKLESLDEEEDDEKKGPLFMYGERIVSRTRRRGNRPFSAVERTSHCADAESIGEDSVDSDQTKTSSLKQRPKSSMGFHRNEVSFDIDEDFCGASDALSIYSRPSTPRGRHIPHQEWEDETFDITKKILKAQERAGTRARESVYQSRRDIIVASDTKYFRGLDRKLRIQDPRKVFAPSPSKIPPDNDFPPKRSLGVGEVLGRRATFTEIMNNQRRPTMSAGAWLSHLGQAMTPMSTDARGEAAMGAKRMVNDSRTQHINERVKSFMKSDRTHRDRR